MTNTKKLLSLFSPTPVCPGPKSEHFIFPIKPDRYFPWLSLMVHVFCAVVVLIGFSQSQLPIALQILLLGLIILSLNLASKQWHWRGSLQYFGYDGDFFVANKATKTRVQIVDELFVHHQLVIITLREISNDKEEYYPRTRRLILYPGILNSRDQSQVMRFLRSC